jgi:hypothetical protein
VIDETGYNQRFDLTVPVKWNLEALKANGGRGPRVNLSEIRKLLSGYGISLQTGMGITDFLVVDRVADEARFMN